MKGNKIISKTLNGYGKFLWIISCVTCIVFMLFSSFMIFEDTKKKNELEYMKQTSGDFHVQYNSLVKEEEQILLDNKYIESYISSPMDTAVINNSNQTVLIQYMEEADIYYTSTELCEGKFPAEEDEIAVEQWFMLQQGYTSDEMLGSKLVLQNHLGELNTYTVVGLISNKISNSAGNEYRVGVPLMLRNKIYLDNEEKYYRNLYLKYKDTQKLIKDINYEINRIDQYRRMNATLELDENFRYNEETGYSSAVDYEINSVFLDALGTDEFVLKNKRKQQVVWLLFLIFLIFSLNNIINICISKWSGVIKLHKQLGANMQSIIWNIFLIVLKYALIGEMIGFLSGYVFVNIVKESLLSYDLNTNTSMSWKILVIGILVSVFIIAVLLILKLGNVCYKTSYEIEIVSSGSFHGKNKIVMYDNLFCKFPMNSLRMALRNLWFYKVRKIMMFLCISFSLLLLFFICFQIQAEVERTKDDNAMYEFQFIPKMFTANETSDYVKARKLYNQIIEICNENGSIPYYHTYEIQNLHLDKRLITESYRLEIENNISDYSNYINSGSEMIIPVAIMGYSKEMIQELASENNLDITGLEKNQCLMLQRTVNREGTYSGILNSAVGYTYEFPIGYTEEYGTYDLEVVGMVKELPVYPEVTKNCVCIVIPLEIFQSYYPPIFGDALFYLKQPSNELISLLETSVCGTDYIAMIDKKEEIQREEDYRKVNNKSCILFFVLSCLIVLLNNLLLYYYDILLRDYEVSLLQALGIPKNKLIKIFLYEIIFLYGIGFLVGDFLITIIRNNIHSFNRTPANHMILNTIWIVMLMLCIVVSICISCNRLKKASILNYYSD